MPLFGSKKEKQPLSDKPSYPTQAKPAYPTQASAAASASQSYAMPGGPEQPPPYTPVAYAQPQYAAPGYAPYPPMGFMPAGYSQQFVSGPPQTVVVQGGFDAGARFDGTSGPNIPPPPPGCMPNAAQMATVQGHNVVMTQQKSSVWTGGSDGGVTFF